VRAFAALLLPVYLTRLGFGAFAIGAMVTATLFGTALLTLAIYTDAQR
jgi:hypothetical protein